MPAAAWVAHALRPLCQRICPLATTTFPAKKADATDGALKRQTQQTEAAAKREADEETSAIVVDTGAERTAVQADEEATMINAGAEGDAIDAAHVTGKVEPEWQGPLDEDADDLNSMGSLFNRGISSIERSRACACHGAGAELPGHGKGADETAAEADEEATMMNAGANVDEEAAMMRTFYQLMALHDVTILESSLKMKSAQAEEAAVNPSLDGNMSESPAPAVVWGERAETPAPLPSQAPTSFLLPGIVRRDVLREPDSDSDEELDNSGSDEAPRSSPQNSPARREREAAAIRKASKTSSSTPTAQGPPSSVPQDIVDGAGRQWRRISRPSWRKDTLDGYIDTGRDTFVPDLAQQLSQEELLADWDQEMTLKDEKPKEHAANAQEEQPEAKEEAAVSACDMGHNNQHGATREDKLGGQRGPARGEWIRGG